MLAKHLYPAAAESSLPCFQVPLLSPEFLSGFSFPGSNNWCSTEKASYCHGACFPSVFEVDKCFCSVAERALCGHDCGNCWRLYPGPAGCWGQLLLCLYTKVSSWEWGRLEVTPSSSLIPRIPLWSVLPELLNEGGVTQASWACSAWASPMALALPSPLPQLCAQGIPPAQD